MSDEPEASIVLIEFSDYQCPFCARYFRETHPRIDSDFVPGQLAYLRRNFPLEQIHPSAFRAGEAVECASRQGKEMAMHRTLFEKSANLNDAQLIQSADELGLSTALFTECLSGKASSIVRHDLESGRRLGVESTPTFFVGVAESGSLRLLRKITGAQPYDTFLAVIGRSSIDRQQMIEIVQ